MVIACPISTVVGLDTVFDHSGMEDVHDPFVHLQ